ncbi:MAG: hypothetical protein H7345_17925 [Rubritepida sp.]|nr:hypothetical protein [Rubritepida sp.]
MTLRELRSELAERGVMVSLWTVWEVFVSADIIFKKSILPAEQERPDIASRRQRWGRLQARVDPSRLVFIDETWANTNMVRTHGRSHRGQRLHAKLPYGY